jgi:3D (Asp-Asp-Asp) domain-containing protein
MNHIRRQVVTRVIAERVVFVLLALVVMASAVATKRSAITAPLAEIDLGPSSAMASIAPAYEAETEIIAEITPKVQVLKVVEMSSEQAEAGTRWFDGRKVRPARTIWMTVTAYSPDHRSCGKYADGITASGKSIWTNGMKLVAADKRLLPFGSMLSIPGYDGGAIVPVLDRGGAIKGARLDVLYPTHSTARKWGVQKLPVVVWEYVDEDSGSVDG